jgi:hypothetical protein
MRVIQASRSHNLFKSNNSGRKNVRLLALATPLGVPLRKLLPRLGGGHPMSSHLTPQVTIYCWSTRLGRWPCLLRADKERPE